MKENLKNILISSSVSAVVAIFIVMTFGVVGGNNQPFGATGTRFPNGISADSTSPSAGQVRGTSLTVTAASTLTGSSTITKSFDGFVAWDDFTEATGTAKAVYTNTAGDMWCNGANGGLLFDNTTAHQAPALQVSMGTSTSATGYSINLLASTTVATTSDQVIGITYTANFLLLAGESIVAALSDTQGTNSSSTNYGNWAGELGFNCRLIGA